MPLTTGTRLGPYEVVAPLGAGGMGEVYRAHDSRLGREVAIKVLPAHVAEEPDRLRRFEEEARTIAGLNHPHICQIYDIGPGYLVLEYIEGEPLHGPLPTNEVLRLAIQIASALEAAHRRGIIHRDLKPANVLVVRGGESTDSPDVAGSSTAKLLDFGLAKLLTTETDVTRTTDGVVVGTAAYMSPEQAEGKPLDVRSDIFSFGAVLYEMLSGTRAFGGQTAAQALSAILRDEPPPLTAPSPLERIVLRCLRKAPSERFPTMTELKAALERAFEQPNDQPSIAVLPFANLSADKENEYFSDGLAEEIINALTHIPGLKVTARTSAFAFRGKEQDITKIAELLRVRTVLEGSVRRAGNRIRVAAQLINAEDGYHLWSERYDREMADVFAVQDEIAQAIAGALQVKLSPSPDARGRPTPKLPAYEAFLKARHYHRKMTPDALARSRQCFEEAITLDPDFAQAHSELGLNLLIHATENLMPAREAAALMNTEARRALAIDPSLSDAHAALGLAAVLDYNWASAQTQFELAMACTPVSSQVRYYYATFFLLSLGRLTEAEKEFARAAQEDPLNIFVRGALGWINVVAGRDSVGEAALRQALELEERFWIACLWLTAVYLRRENLADAQASAEKMYALVPAHPFAIGLLAGIMSRVGDTNSADRLLAKLGDGSAYGAPSGHVCYHMVRSEIDLAADWFRQAIAQRDTRAPGILPRLFGDLLMSSQHWPSLARLMNLPTTS
jgi:TolB-like protein/Tfp pilus assembly protein PilF